MPFVKGQSGNPGGRVKMPEEIREMFRAKGTDAIDVVTKHLAHDDARIALQAAQIILERAYGKVPQAIEGGDAPIQTEATIIVTGVPRKGDQ